MAEFGIDPSSLVGFVSDGAAVMVAAGRELGIIHQTCLGKVFVVQIKLFLLRIPKQGRTEVGISTSTNTGHRFIKVK